MIIEIIERIKIKTSKNKVLNQVLDLENWDIWSPWTYMDPNIKVKAYEKINGHCSKMKWEGKFTGKGEMITEKTRDNGIDVYLVFFKPFKSKAKSAINVICDEDNTIVEWKMISRLSFFMFFLKKILKKSLSKDYNRGLKRLKLLLETGEIASKIDFVDQPFGVSSFNFCGVDVNHTYLVDLPKVMSENFEKIHKETQDIKANVSEGCCFCNKFNFLKDMTDLSLGYSYSGNISSSYLKTKNIPNHKAIKVILTGDYIFMEDAWAAIINHSRILKLKPSKKVAPYEKYIKGPHNCSNPKTYITEIYFPIK